MELFSVVALLEKWWNYTFVLMAGKEPRALDDWMDG